MGKRAVSRLFYCISIILTFILAGVTLAGAFVQFISPGKVSPIAFIGLALPVLLLLNLVVAIYWSIRWRYWVVVPLVAILGNWGYMSRVYQLPSSGDKPAAGTVRIATYNVNSFGKEISGFSCKEIARFMRDQRVDILCFQEFAGNRDFTVDSIKNALSDWSYCAIPESDTPILQIALFSKYPIIRSELITYPDSRNCSMWCDIDLNGRTIRIFNNHLQTTEVSRNKRKLEKELKQGAESGDMEARGKAATVRLLDGLADNFKKRAAQAETLQKIIETTPYPVLVCGDFNSLPSSYTYHTVKGSKLKDGFQTCGHGYMYTFRYFKRLLRIDYIFHSKEFEGIDYFSPDLDLTSDHNPVIMEVK